MTFLWHIQIDITVFVLLLSKIRFNMSLQGLQWCGSESPYAYQVIHVWIVSALHR